MKTSPGSTTLALATVRNCRLALLAFVVTAQLATCGRARAQIDFDVDPINYDTAPSNDPVNELQKAIDDGTQSLVYDKARGYLPAVLELLKIEPSSQVLVHSKTSFQLRRISPKRPRALYFNDQSYVGWVQGGDVVEVMTTDPQLGAIFYTLSQEQVDRPEFVRDAGQCITCHATSKTQGVPGGLVRSVFVDPTGQPQFGSGTFTIDHRSPFEDRWGGWFVTGTHGTMRHMGNTTLQKRQHPKTLDRETGANLVNLDGQLDTTPYLTPHSDIVALMVLEHQTQMQNYLTRLNYECRSATHYDGIMSAALGRPDDFVSDSTKRRIASAGEKLLRYMLFADEFALAAPVNGSSSFAQDFQNQGLRDQQGRSLRDFDLKTRMFKYPCSYLVDSPSFDALPELAKQYVVQRLHDVLTGHATSDEFEHLSNAERRAILQILSETKPGLWDLAVSGTPASNAGSTRDPAGS